MSALPPISNVSFDSEGIRAWNFLLRAEGAARTEPSSHAKYKDHLVGVRVLGWFMKDFWDHPSHRFGTTPYKRLLSEIIPCLTVCNVVVGSLEEFKAQCENVYTLGLMYRNYLMRVFRSATGPNPSPSPHISRPSFENYKEQVMVAMNNAPKTKADVKKLALHRDGYRCVITGAYDLRLTSRFPEISEEQPVKGAPTQCAHLFSESAQSAGKDYASTAFTMLEMFGLKDEVHNLLGGQVDSLCNVLTMTGDMHTCFDDFTFWLEEVEGELNTYDVVSYIEGFHQKTGARKRVTLNVDPAVVKDYESKRIPLPNLPDPSLIAIRAFCARVAHMSGAAEQNDEILEDREMILVLASDGSNADLLQSLLNRRVTEVEVSG